MDASQTHLHIALYSATYIPWEPPQAIMFSLSSIRDDPFPHTPSLRLHPKVVATNLGTLTPAPLPRAILPKYTADDPQVLDLLAQCSSSPMDTCPLASHSPRWVFVVAALSTYSHPSYPAHLAFWRPDIMNETGQMIDRFLKTKEAKYLKSREGWIDSEISLYTLRGFQRGHYPELYSPNQSTRTLRKRKVGMITAGIQDDLEEEEEERSKKRTKRMTRTSAARHNVAKDDEEPLDSSISVVIEDDAALPIPAELSQKNTRTNRVPNQKQEPVLPTRPTFKRHKRRSSSLTSSGISLANSVATADTLIEEDKQDDADARSVVSVDTAVESVPEQKEPGNDKFDTTEKLALLVDLATASALSPLSWPSSTPPPPSRRSTRTVRPPKRTRDMEGEEQEKDVIMTRSQRVRSAARATPSAPAKRRRKPKRA